MKTVKQGIWCGWHLTGDGGEPLYDPFVKLEKDDNGDYLFTVADCTPRRIPAADLPYWLLGAIIEPGPKFHHGYCANPLLEKPDSFAGLFSAPKEGVRGYSVHADGHGRHFAYGTFTPSKELQRIVDDVTPLFGSVYFDLHCDKTGRAYVFIKANQIIASRYVAQIASDTIPF